MDDLYKFDIEAGRDGRWELVATWERFGMDEAEALAGTIKAARVEFPADALRVRLHDPLRAMYELASREDITPAEAAVRLGI